MSYQTTDGAYGTLRLTPTIDAQAPSVSVSTSPSVLWPPNGALVTVAVAATAADDYDPSPACAIVQVLDTEHLGGGFDPDVRVTGPLTVLLRAARRTGHGRVYLLKVHCTDFSGNGTSAYTLVVAPSER